MGVQEILAIANGLALVIGGIATQLAKLRGLAAKAGATDAELAEMDGRLTAAIAARIAER